MSFAYDLWRSERMDRETTHVMVYGEREKMNGNACRIRGIFGFYFMD